MRSVLGSPPASRGMMTDLVKMVRPSINARQHLDLTGPLLMFSTDFTWRFIVTENRSTDMAHPVTIPLKLCKWYFFSAVWITWCVNTAAGLAMSY